MLALCCRVGNNMLYAFCQLSIATVRVDVQAREDTTVQLDSICRQAGIKLLVVRSYGLVGLVRVRTNLSIALYDLHKHTA